jgi:ribosomal protein L11 methyltransferase
MKKNKNIFELSLRAMERPGAAQFLRLILLNRGFSDDKIIEYLHYPYVFLKVYLNRRPKASRTLAALKLLKLKEVELKLNKLSSKVWRKKGEETFKPFKLTKRLSVIPEKDCHKFKNNLENKIILTTGLAFGTGLHETTRFMAQIIEKDYQPSMSLLDIGTGTGILSLVALKKGAKNLMAIDLSKDCINTAQKNFSLNRFQKVKKRAIDLNKFKPADRYDFVVANLITKVLISSKSKLISVVRPQGFLAVSGISLENYSFFRDHFKDARLKCEKVVKGQEWAAILFRKIS